MKLYNKLEIDSTLKVGALPTASTSNFSVLFENEGLVSKRTVGDIINKNTTDFIQGISNSFPSIFNYNTSTTPSDSNLVVSFKNQLAGTVFAAPTTLNGTPSFRKLIDSDLSETSIFSQLGNYVTLDTEQDITGKKTFSSLYHKIGTNPAHVEFDFEGNPSDSIMRIISNYGNQTTQMQYEAYPEGVGFMSFFRTDGNITVSPFTLYTRRVGLSQFTLRTGSNTEVFKISGDTTNTTNWFFQMPNANMKFALGYWSNNAAFDIEDVKAAFRGSIYSSSNVFANGFKKHDSSNDHVLLGQGGHKLISDFALSTDIPDVSNFVTNTRTITAGNGLTGGGNLTANRTITLGTPSSVGLTSTNSVTTSSHTHALDASTITEIGKGQQALTNIGNLNSLTTTNKTSVVNAINEVNSNTNNIQIGGRNLLLDSKELKNTGGLASGISRTINQEGHLEITAASGNGNYASGLGIVIKPDHGLQNGDVITVSIKVKSEDATGLPTLYLGNGMPYLQFNGQIGPEFSTIQYTRVWNGSHWVPHMGFAGISGTFVFKEIKLEKGNKATDWTPAPEDQVSDWNETDSNKFSFIKNKPEIPTVNDGQLSLTTGNGLTGSATFTANQSGNSSFSVGIASTHKLPTITEWNALSTQTLSSSTSNLIVSNTVQRAALTGDVTASQNSNVTTIANNAVTHAKYQNIPTQRILGRGAAGTGNVQELTIGANLTLSTTGVLSATNTNTTYSAGTGLSLSGTTFGQTITTSGTGTYVQSITQTANGFQVNLGTPPNTNTTYSAGTLALLQAGTNTSNRVWSPKTLADGVIRKGVNNVNPEGEPFSIHANYGSLDWNGNGFSFITDSEQEFTYIEDEQAIGVNPFQDYGCYFSNQRLRFSNAGNRSDLLPSSGASKSKLPTTGSTQRTLAAGATMGGNTYYANENGLIDLPSSDGILSYSSANGIIVTDWNSFALSEYAMSLGYGSVTSGNYATSVGGLLSTTGFGSTNQGYSNSITKALGYSLGAYNSVRATLSGAFGIGLINRNDGAFVVGRYNSELPIEPYDTTSPHKQAVFAIGAGRDDTDRYTALTVYGDGRADYAHGYDDSTWTDNTLVTKKWVRNNSGGGITYRNVNEESIFDLSLEYSVSLAESVYNVRTERPVVFIGGDEVFHDGYKVTIMTNSDRTDVSLDSSRRVKFRDAEDILVPHIEGYNSITFIYDKEYSSFRVYHKSFISLN